MEQQLLPVLPYLLRHLIPAYPDEGLMQPYIQKGPAGFRLYVDLSLAYVNTKKDIQLLVVPALWVGNGGTVHSFLRLYLPTGNLGELYFQDPDRHCFRHNKHPSSTHIY